MKTNSLQKLREKQRNWRKMVYTVLLCSGRMIGLYQSVGINLLHQRQLGLGKDATKKGFLSGSLVDQLLNMYLSLSF